MLLFLSKQFWYLFLNKLNSSSITSSDLSLILIYMLSLFECITRSSSLSSIEDELIAIVN